MLFVSSWDSTFSLLQFYVMQMGNYETPYSDAHALKLVKRYTNVDLVESFRKI